MSFVGSSSTLRIMYTIAASRTASDVQAMGGAKNHGIVMPDADLDQVVNDPTGAAFGSAGERYMALPVVVPVGSDTAERLKAKCSRRSKKLKVGISTDAGRIMARSSPLRTRRRSRGWIPNLHRRRR